MNIATLLKTKSIQIDGKIAKTSVVEQQTREKGNLSFKQTLFQVNENDNASRIWSENKSVLLNVQQEVSLKLTTICENKLLWQLLHQVFNDTNIYFWEMFGARIYYWSNDWDYNWRCLLRLTRCGSQVNFIDFFEWFSCS